MRQSSEDLGLEEAVDLLAIQVLVAHAFVEGLAPAICNGFPGRGRRVGAVEASPLVDGGGDNQARG
jgi:hypothetical protein